MPVAQKVTSKIIKPASLRFRATIQQFGAMGEKTGWRYIYISSEQSELLQPGCRKSYRVTGCIDAVEIKQIALLPMGDGGFILALKQDLRRALKKSTGDQVLVEISAAQEPFQLHAELLECLKDEPEADAFFKTLPGGHQRYFSQWISSAKQESTRLKRIAMAVNALAKKWGYPEMIRAEKAKKVE